MAKPPFSPVRYEATIYRAGAGLLAGRSLRWAWYAEVQAVDADGRKRRVWGRKCLNETHAKRTAETKQAALAANHERS